MDPFTICFLIAVVGVYWFVRKYLIYRGRKHIQSYDVLFAEVSRRTRGLNLGDFVRKMTYLKGIDRVAVQIVLKHDLRDLIRDGYVYIEKLNGEALIRLTQKGRKEGEHQRGRRWSMRR